jgi:putative ABC transport system ATP-binding protein
VDNGSDAAFLNKTLILADEPTGNQIVRPRLKAKLFGDIHANGNTVILVTHERKLQLMHT